MNRCQGCNAPISARAKVRRECRTIRRNARRRQVRVTRQLRGTVCHASARPHWRTGNECMYDGLCTANTRIMDRLGKPLRKAGGRPVQKRAPTRYPNGVAP